MNNDFYSQNDFRLYHSGVLGMKWYVRMGPPYPLKPEQHSASERKAGWQKSLPSNRRVVGGTGGSEISNSSKNLSKTFLSKQNISGGSGKSLLSNIKERVQQKKEAKAKSKAEEEEAKKKAAEEAEKKAKADADEKAKKEKEDLINSGDPEAIYKAAKEGKLNGKELQEAVNRVNLYKNLENSIPKPETVNKMQVAANKLKDVSTLAKNGVETWNAVADIVNSISPDFQMPKVDGNALGRARKAREEELKDILKSKDADKIMSVSKELTSKQLSEFNNWVDANNILNKRKDAETRAKEAEGQAKAAEKRAKEAKEAEERAESRAKEAEERAERSKERATKYFLRRKG